MRACRVLHNASARLNKIQGNLLPPLPVDRAGEGDAFAKMQSHACEIHAGTLIVLAQCHAYA